MIVSLDLSVSGANALCGGHAVGYPGIPAFAGLANAFSRAAAAAYGTTHRAARGVCIIHHAGALRAHGPWKNRLTHKRSVHTDDSIPTRANMFFDMATRVEPQADLAFTLLADLDLPDKLVEEIDEARLSQERHSPADDLVPVRGLGGRATLNQSVRLVDDIAEGVRKSRRGWVLKDHTHELGQGSRPIEELATRCRNPRSLPAEASDAQRAACGRVPMHIGYLGIGTAGNRPGSRDSATLHWFAEPVTGLARFTRKHEAMEAGIGSAMWRPSINADTKLFTLRGE